jgi:DNA-binding SARP family transcriptional activator
MPSDIRITLFGRFSVQFCGETVLDHAPHKVQELLAYLLLNPGRPHPREALADLLWEDCESPHAKKYLRQALWQLHAGLLAVGRSRASRLIHQEPGWVELDVEDCAWVDTVQLERAFLSVRGRTEIQAPLAPQLVDAVQLYRGDLLEGWNFSWCSYERDRFREMYLAILDKLVAHYETKGDYEAGIALSMLALRSDRARERTHRHMMRLQYLSGDRTGALRQYERCVSALREELEIAPSIETLELHRTICSGAGVTVNGNGNAGSHGNGTRPRRTIPRARPKVGLTLTLPTRDGDRRTGI